MSSTLIPKKIHYVWVGGRPLPLTAKKCLASWQTYLPDYEIRRWDESNSPMEHPYVKEMYRRQKWAFVSDYIRFYVLHNEGGIYLDTDMEILKPLDRFLSDRVFFGRTSSDGYISCGIIGTVAGQPFIKKVLEEYDKRRGEARPVTSPQTVTASYSAYPAKEEIAVYGPEYFYPCNAGEHCAPEKLARAYATHHWSESWASFRLARKLLRKVGVLKYIKRLI